MDNDIKVLISKNLQAFASGNLTSNALQLFQTLGYNTERQSSLSATNFSAFKNSFIASDSKFDEKKANVKDWVSVDMLFQLSKEELLKMDSLFKPTFERNDPASYLFFVIELSGSIYSRNQLAQISREINKLFPMHVFVLFKYNNMLTFSMIDRRQNKKVLDRDVLETVTHIYCISIAKPHPAHVQIFYSLSFDAIKAEAPKKRIESFRDLQNGWRKVISTEILNKQFYLDYQHLSVALIKTIHPKQIKSKLVAHQGILNLLNRIMFIYFVQKKEWIMNDQNFMIHFWNDYKETKKKDIFHKDWLNSIFFSAFNGIAYKEPKVLKALPEPYKTEILTFPYLNGGLFAFNDDYDNFELPDAAFEEIFKFFESYIFTITEDTPYDVNLEINPELLGKMYEGMINATDLDDVDAENGIIYTERPEINFMTRRSFVEVLDKKLNSSLSREFLYHFIFDTPEQKKEALKRYKIDAKSLRIAITSITVCDPACGSGSMLLGSIQLQMECLRVLDEYIGNKHSEKDDFTIKKQLISECIYGVDIKEWAVRIAELRLWLYMIAEAEFSKEELTKNPLLPNLDFKLRQGNSLLQKFGNLEFTVEELLKGRDKKSGATRKLTEFIKKKKEFIVNQTDSNTTYKKLKKEEFEVFLDFIDEMIIEKKQLIQQRGVQNVKQESMFGEDERVEQKNLFEEEISKLNEEIGELKELKQNIQKEKRLPFSYDIDFMEIFLTNDDPGFDLIIGNPPYVRQEEILPPEDGEYLEYLLRPNNKAEKAEVNKAYKELLNYKIYKTYPFLNTTIKTQIEGKNKSIPIYGTKVPGRSDLFCYFQLLCPSFMNSKGTFCFIISNAWLDVEYGNYIQHFLLKHTNLAVIYDCNSRSFDASINTIIYIHSALQSINLPPNAYKNLQVKENKVQFVMNKIDYTASAYAPLLLEQEHCSNNTFKELYRVITLTQKELFESGFSDEEYEYVGDKWGGKYLRAPEVYYEILNKGKNILVDLDSIASVRFGMKSGANDFFYLPSRYYDIKENGNSYSLLPKEDGLPENIEIDKSLLKPILFSLKEVSSPLLNSKDFDSLYFSSELNKNSLGKAKKYIEWGESKNYHKVPTTMNRKPFWYSLDSNFSPADIIFPSKIGERFVAMDNCKAKILEDKKQYGVFIKKKESAIIYFNSTIFRFMVELMSPQLTGAQAISDITVNVFNKTPIIDFIKYDLKIPKSFESFIKRKSESIFTELGFDKKITIREQHPKPLSDRKELDDIIFDALKLSNEERNEVYWSVAELVKQRLDKAASR